MIPLVLRSYFCAREVEGAACTACGDCEKYCPTAAIRMTDFGRTIAVGMCIGCGQCVHRCPQQALELIPEERKVVLPLKEPSEVRIPA